MERVSRKGKRKIVSKQDFYELEHPPKYETGNPEYER